MHLIKHLLLLFLLLSTFASRAQYPGNIFPDTAFAPFYYGVASGDPLQDRVIIWTKVAVKDVSVKNMELKWQVAADKNFAEIITEGNLTTSASLDFTAKKDVDGLQPQHNYFYRFITADNKISQTGMMKTLPADTVSHFKLAVVSCSSIWSGYFNAYARIAERSDVDFVVHLGDYVYDYADEDEHFRMPAKFPKDVSSLAEWRERHTYYLLDPDLRAARQNKTWIAEWDNHDTDVEPPGKTEEAIQAFYEYLPIRMPDTLHPENIYRTFHFGLLADLNMIDMQLFRGKEEYAPGKKSVLGNVQDAWFKKQLLESKAIWKIVGNQEMMGSWYNRGANGIEKTPGSEKYFDTGQWDGFPDDRNRLFDFVETNGINNLVVMTGDIHMIFVMDLTKFPHDKTTYNRQTGKGAVGVEFTVPSVSRGNMYEAGVPVSLIPTFEQISLMVNPHHRYCQFSNHGYATLDVNAQQCRVEFRTVKTLVHTAKEMAGKSFVVKNGDNHWKRPRQ